MFGHYRKDLTGGWRKWRNEQFHNFYFSSNIIRMIRSRRIEWAEHTARMGEKINEYKVLEVNPGGKRLLERSHG
jgi:hypothetical protein